MLGELEHLGLLRVRFIINGESESYCKFHIYWQTSNTAVHYTFISSDRGPPPDLFPLTGVPPRQTIFFFCDSWVFLMKKWLATAKPGNRGGDSEGWEDMEHMMEDEEVEDREEDEESVGEEEGEGEIGGEGNEEEVEGEGGEELEVGEGGDDEDYEREAPPRSDIDGCDWDGLSVSFMT